MTPSNEVAKPKPPHDEATLAELRAWLRRCTDTDVDATYSGATRHELWEVIRNMTDCTIPSRVLPKAKRKAKVVPEAKGKAKPKAKAQQSTEPPVTEPEQPDQQQQQQQGPAAAPTAQVEQQHPAPDQPAAAPTSAVQPDPAETMRKILQDMLPAYIEQAVDRAVQKTLNGALPQKLAIKKEPSEAPVTIDLTNDAPRNPTTPTTPATPATPIDLDSDTERPPPQSVRKGKRTADAMESEEEEDTDFDYNNMSEDRLRELMQRFNLPHKGLSRARMAFQLQKHEAGASWKDEPVPQIPEDEITFEDVERILGRTANGSKTYNDYLGYFRRLNKKGLLNDLCNPSYIKDQYVVPMLKKDNKTLKKAPQTVGKLPDALDCGFENMEEIEIFRLLFNNNLRNTPFLDAVKAAKSKQELHMLFRELRDQYGIAQYTRNLKASILRRVKDPELNERQKAQCVLPTSAMLEDVWPRYKKFYYATLRRTQPQDGKLKRHRNKQHKDQLQLIFTCQEWLKLHLHINEDALRNDLAKLVVGDPVIKKGQVYIDFESRHIIFYRANKTGTEWNYDTLLKVDREETWEMLMEMVKVQKLLGRKYVFCNTYRCNRGEDKGQWKRQSENYYGSTFSEYFGRVFKTKDGRFCPSMLRTLATCEQNVRDNVPEAHELPYRQAKGKNHSLQKQMENDYNNRGVPAYAESEYAKTKAANASILLAGDADEDEEGGGSEKDGMEVDEMEVDEEYEGGPSRDPHVSASPPPLAAPLDLPIFSDGSDGADIA
jgi:hypothetical protein